MSNRVTRSMVAGMVAITFLAAVAPPAGADAGFGDVWPGRYYTRAVQWMVDEAITGGVTPECFAPQDVVTRGQAAAFLWRMEGRPVPAAAHGFGDVAQPWQQDPVSWLSGEGVTTGVTASTFEPERALTRAEFATLLWRLAGSPPGSTATAFGDVPPGAFFARAVGWMVALGITQGTTPSTFSPERTVTRGEVATFLHRYKGSPPVTVDPAGAPCAIEFRPDVRLRVHEPAVCPAGGSAVIMTGGPNSSVFAGRFTERGYVHVDVDYRLPGYTGAFSAASVRAIGWSVSDLATAVRWVRAHADGLCVDPDRVAAAGYSYGAITALTLAYTVGELDPGDPVVAPGLGTTLAPDGPAPPSPPELAGFSPDVDAAFGFAGFALADTVDAGEPPSLLFNSPTDSVIPFGLAEATCAAATRVGVTCELVSYAGGHIIAPIIDSGLDDADDFLQREMGPG